MALNDHASASDQALLLSFQRTGDHAAFAEIVNRYADAVFAACRRVLQNHARAEEAVQETFFKLVKQPYAVDHSLGGWLHRTATRLAIDAVRTDARRRSRERRHVAAAGQIAHEAQSWDDVSPHLDEALQALPEPAQWVLIQHFLRQRPLRELAGERDVSAATMSRRLAEALNSLKLELRRRGVIAAPAMVVAFLNSEAAVAAPIALAGQLNRITMFSATAASTGAGAAAGASWFGLCTSWVCSWGGAVVAAVLAMVGVLGLLMGPTEWGGASADVRVSQTTSIATATAVPPRYVVLPHASDDFSSNHVVAFEDPRTITGLSLNVAFGDGHVVSLPLEEVRQRVAQQTGRPLEAFLAPMP